MDVKLPQLAEGVESGTVVSVLVSEGQAIKKDQPIMELETQKAVGSIPSPASGTVTKIHVREGTEVGVGQVLISLEAADLAGKEAPAATPGHAPSRLPEPAIAEAEPATRRGGDRYVPEYRYEPKSGIPPPAAPSIRKLARELGIDLARVKGSEAGGRIILGDLRSYIQRLQDLVFQRTESVSGPAAGGAQPQPESIDFSKWGPVRRERMSPLRRTVSQRMIQSWTSIPKINQFDEADISDILKLRKRYAPVYEKTGTHLTLTSLLLKVVADTLKKHPRANASLDETANEVVYKDYIHIGIAVDTEAGLIVPVIRDVDKKDLLRLSQELQEVTDKARQRKLSLDELQGGTFTISNQGSIGGAHFTPIIYSPQVAILGVGQAQAKPCVVQAKIEIRTMVPLCFAYDHRVLDGGDAVRCLKDMIGALQSFPEANLNIT